MSVPGGSNSLLLTSAAAGPSVAENYSLRFNRADNAYLTRTPASASNRKTWTWSGWIKRTSINNSQIVFYARLGTTDIFKVEFETADTIFFEGKVAGTNTLLATTTRVFRDTSAWYHLVFSLNASSLQFKVYVNGVEETLTSVTGPSNQDYIVNSTAPHYIGGWITTANCDFYLAEVNFVDGQALAPTAFGASDATTGVWNPIEYTGSYGTNGYYLNFADNTSTTSGSNVGIGKDVSGNGNYWNSNNISVTPGVGNDSLADYITNGTTTDTGYGGEISGNYCTWNPLSKTSGITLGNGNLDVNGDNSNYHRAYGTIAMNSGKWYWEMTCVTLSTFNQAFAGISLPGDYFIGYGYYSDNGRKYQLTSSSLFGDTFTAGDVVGIAFDADNGKIWFSKNGTWQASGNPGAGTNPAFSSIPSADYFPAVTIAGATVYSANFGQRAFEHSAPSGFKALCTANLDDPLIENPSTLMDVKLYTGNSSTQTISGLGFSPDFVWLKQRTNPENHGLFDTVRGAQNSLCSNNANAENASDTNSLTAFTSDGFSLGNTSRFNDNTYAHVAWAWDAGTSNVPNTDGSISSTVRANPSAGFSTIIWGGTKANATVGHGLGVTPKFIIFKTRGNPYNWRVYHVGVGNTAALGLNLTQAASASISYFNNSSPTSSVINLGTSDETNDTSMIAYCWAPVESYSAFGSYTGNGINDGPFVYTGFRPKFLLFKPSTIIEQWSIRDASRDTYNPAGSRLFPNLSNAESTANNIDLVSNGFKVRGNANQENALNETYVWAAFAENPFKYARAR